MFLTDSAWFQCVVYANISEQLSEQSVCCTQVVLVAEYPFFSPKTRICSNRPDTANGESKTPDSLDPYPPDCQHTQTHTHTLSFPAKLLAYTGTLDYRKQIGLHRLGRDDTPHVLAADQPRRHQHPPPLLPPPPSSSSSHTPSTSYRQLRSLTTSKRHRTHLSNIFHAEFMNFNTHIRTVGLHVVYSSRT